MNTTPPLFGETFRQFHIVLDMRPGLEWQRVGIGGGRLQALAHVQPQEESQFFLPSDSPPKSTVVGSTREATPRFGGAPRLAGMDARKTVAFLNETVQTSQWDAQRLWNSLAGNRPSEKFLSSALNGVNEALLCIDELMRTDAANAEVYQQMLIDDVLTVAKDILCQIYRFDLSKLSVANKSQIIELNARLCQFTNNRRFSADVKYKLVIFVRSLVAPILLKTNAHTVGMLDVMDDTQLAAFYERIYEINSTALSALLVTEELKESGIDKNMSLVSMIAAAQKHLNSILKAVAHAQRPESKMSENPLIKDVIHVAVINAVLFSMNTTLNELNLRLEGLPASGRGSKRNIVQGILDAVCDMEDTMDDVAVALASLGINSPY